MALSRAARRPIWMILSTRMSVYMRSYSSCIYQVKESKTNSVSPFALLSRRFTSQVSASSDQMNLIKHLGERTSASIKDVKLALVDCNWEIEAAQKELRKRGKVLASKKSSRTASEGLLAVAQNEGKAAVIDLNCETDFVSRNEIFQYLALSLAKQVLLVDDLQQASGVYPVGPENLEDLKLNLEHPKISGETTVRNAITDVAAMMGENVKLRRGFVMSTSSHGIVSTYLRTSPQPANATSFSLHCWDFNTCMYGSYCWAFIS